MDVAEKETLVQAGIGVDEAVSRLMNNEDIFLRVLKKFKEDKSFPNLEKAVEAGDVTMTFESAHALKGVGGNLGFTELLEVLHPITETARAGSMEGIAERMPALRECYNKVIRAIDVLD